MFKDIKITSYYLPGLYLPAVKIYKRLRDFIGVKISILQMLKLFFSLFFYLTCAKTTEKFTNYLNCENVNF